MDSSAFVAPLVVANGTFPSRLSSLRCLPHTRASAATQICRYIGNESSRRWSIVRFGRVEFLRFLEDGTFEGFPVGCRSFRCRLGSTCDATSGRRSSRNTPALPALFCAPHSVSSICCGLRRQVAMETADKEGERGYM